MKATLNIEGTGLKIQVVLEGPALERYFAGLALEAGFADLIDLAVPAQLPLGFGEQKKDTPPTAMPKDPPVGQNVRYRPEGEAAYAYELSRQAAAKPSAKKKPGKPKMVKSSAKTKSVKSGPSVPAAVGPKRVYQVVGLEERARLLRRATKLRITGTHGMKNVEIRKAIAEAKAKAKANAQ